MWKTQFDFDFNQKSNSYKTPVSKFFMTAVILYLTKFIYMLLHENIFHEQIIPTSFSEKKSANRLI